jgi:5-carboxymethyl-2-hydroxymuconate isomerase
MPHLIVEYSANLEDSLDVRHLVAGVHQCVIDSKLAEIPAIRSRAERRDVCIIADGDPNNGFVHITARLRIGRPEETRKALADALLAAAEKSLQNAYAKHAIAVTVEIEEIDNVTSRRNTIHSKEHAA